jgi:DNA-binding transcriptional MocR family regulator
MAEPMPLEALQAQLDELRSKNVTLDLSRGRPAAEQLDLSNAMLSLPGACNPISEEGFDIRNYGGPDGLIEIRRIFADLFGIDVEQYLALTNGSLRLMHDTLLFAILFGVPGSEMPWSKQGNIKFICPVPGYDRHFALCEALGIEMISVPINDDGPDAKLIAELTASDPSIKGMWLVPTYSNPTGVTTSPAVLQELLSMKAAPDFRIFYDDAYAFHHLTDDEPAPLPALQLAAEAGNPDRVFFFSSTSKITFAGAGVGFFAGSPANLEWLRKRVWVQSIGPDKTSQLRHAMFLGDPAGVRAQMRNHKEILAPKFAAVDRILRRRLADWPNIANWNLPKGGYFISLNVMPGTAKRVVELAGSAGVILTPAGATFPYGIDPQDSNLRIAPSQPTLHEVEFAAEVLALSVLIAAGELTGQ